MQFVQEAQFSQDLSEIEAEPALVDTLTIRIEGACQDQLTNGKWGYGFARVQWRDNQELFVWYDAADGIVTLLAIDPWLIP